MTRPRRLRAATRSSPLARWQTDHVAALLHGAHPEVVVEAAFVDTLGDRTQSLGTPLHELGGQGVFVKEVQAAVLREAADFAVHSAKDLPSTPAPGLVIAAVPARGDVRDLLVGATLESLRSGARVGTSSVRRIAQLRAIRPDLEFVQIRGNVGSRVARVGELDAVVVAAAGAERLGLIPELAERHPIEWLAVDVVLPMVSQGALAVECRVDDDRTRSLLGTITHADSLVCVTAERAFLATLGAGCDLPVAALATVDHELLDLRGLVAAEDGSRIVASSDQGDRAAAETIGRAVGASVLASGARDLLRRD